MNYWKHVFAVAMLPIVIAPPHTLQYPVKEPAASIGVRNGHAMVYEGIRGRVILFGGADDAKVCGDTWAWDGRRWTQVAITGPGPRTFPAMAYDSRRRKVILFGGNKVLFGANVNENRFLDDTWEWDGVRWVQLKVPGPPARAEAAIAFDSRRGRVVLFGGYHRVNGKLTRRGDTWEWDGSKWLEFKRQGPAPRNGSALVYDRSRRKTILFGGGTTEGVSGETWEWDGRQWTENRSALTEGRFNPAMAYDDKRQKVVRFGGRYAGKPAGDTWEYDGKNWKQLAWVGPAPRNHAAMTYYQELQKIVLFGGHDFGIADFTNVFGDTWELDPNGWLLQDAGETKRRVENGHE